MKLTFGDTRRLWLDRYRKPMVRPLGLFASSYLLLSTNRGYTILPFTSQHSFFYLYQDNMTKSYDVVVVGAGKPLPSAPRDVVI